MTQFEDLLNECSLAIEDSNLDQCLKILLKNVSNKSSIYDIVLHQSALFKASSRDNDNSLLTREQYRREYSQVTNALITLLKELKEVDCFFVENIHERILILTYEASKVGWVDIFPKKKFSHIEIINYDADIPKDYNNPVVVIFDDSGPDARPYMLQFAEKMPKAYFLYFGESGQNPFSESRKRNPGDAAIFERCANANSKFTVHARLRELLEFRKDISSV